MLRFRLAAANAVLGRKPTPAVSVAVLRSDPVQQSTCFTCSPSHSIFRVSAPRHLHGRNAHGGTRHVGASTKATVPNCSNGPTACHPSTYHGLSLVILLQECIRRVFSRPLVEASDPLALPTQLDSLPCCVVLLAPDLPPPFTTAATPDASALSEPASLALRSSVRVQYMNRAAAEALKAVNAGESTTATATATTTTTAAATPTSPAVANSIGGGGDSSSRAAKADVSPRSVSWPLLEPGPDGVELLLAVLSKQGAPQRGEVRCLKLRTAARMEASAEGSVPAITCPETLVMPLMSPNGMCAGAALLFDRWQVRGAEGDVLLEGRPLVPEIPPGSQPRAEDLRELQQAVRSQADDVRALKTQQGRGNQDPLVVEAVAGLQRLKADLELTQRLREAFSNEAGLLTRLLLQGAE